MLQWLRGETVLCVAWVLALVTAVLVPPDAQYIDYVDLHTLGMLFALMAVMAGLQRQGLFFRLGRAMLERTHTTRQLEGVLILLPFFVSMAVTNDVALITFVPFALEVLSLAGQTQRVVPVVVMQTIAANLGSMATPIGNPQNLYLFSVSGLSMGQFARAVLPCAGLSLAALLAAALLQPREALRAPEAPVEEARRPLLPGLLPYLGLLVLCLLVVFRVVDYRPALVCVVAVVLLADRKLFRSVDYFLLLTFLCFFLFIGNLKRIPALNDLLRTLVQGRELWAGILASQVISNVPAAILLSGFTEDFSTLLTAVNLGGLGTPIASLASLISFKFYTAAYPGRKGAFLRVFTLWNVGFLLLLIPAALLLG